MSARKTIALDFDGVIHSYVRGWTGPVPSDPPVPGARAAIAKLRETYRVVIFTCRALTQDGIIGIRAWLGQHGIEVDEVTAIKPHAMLYVDDRGMRFTGSWENVLRVAGDPRLLHPWNHDGPAPLVDPVAWEATPPRCGTCGAAVDAVTPSGHYTACGHAIPDVAG